MVEQKEGIGDIHLSGPPEVIAKATRVILGFQSVNPEVLVTIGEELFKDEREVNYNADFVCWIKAEDDDLVPVVTSEGIRRFAIAEGSSKNVRVAKATMRGLQTQLDNPSANYVFEPFVVTDEGRLLGLRADRLEMLTAVLRQGMPKLEGVRPQSAALLIKSLDLNVRQTNSELAKKTDDKI